jgi:hypothetical protein
VPLHAGAPGDQQLLRAASLDGVPRVACASLLVRILTPGERQVLGSYVHTGDALGRLLGYWSESVSGRVSGGGSATAG